MAIIMALKAVEASIGAWCRSKIVCRNNLILRIVADRGSYRDIR